MMKKMERVELLLEYLRQLDSLKANGYQCHKEIVSCTKEIAKELNLPDVNRVEVPDSKTLETVKAYCIADKETRGNI
jgi:plastocyanin domain-containing protein